MHLENFLEYNPHHVLGFHEHLNGSIIRLWRPGASKVFVEVKGFVHETIPSDTPGFFVFESKEKISKNDYRIYHANGLIAHDPYSFLPAISEMNAYLWNAGCHYEPYRFLGANFKEIDGIEGTLFSLWAPNAKAVSLVCDVNLWDGRVNPMRSLGSSGIWELFVPDLKDGVHYKYEIVTKDEKRLLKCDPFAFFAEKRPSDASIVFSKQKHSWQDANWLEKRKSFSLNHPMNIYELHLGSWKRGLEDFLNYKELAIDLAQYVLEMGFSHIELLPILEHPLDDSWGYQVTGFYAPTSRFGTPLDFQWFIDHMHQNGIGVILDWVPAHFPLDEFALAKFDGSFLFEHADPKKGIHPHWKTAIFNFGRKEVSNFLIGSALFWLKEMHLDGLRVDAVASLLYLDYGRKEGEWIPNSDGGHLNYEAIEFLKHLNSIVKERCPSAFMIAEESSAFPGVTKEVSCGGLGFDLKWNLGWMHDTLQYFSKDPIYRRHHQENLTFGLLYAFSEKFLLVLSHDEVVHMKASFLSKMPGSDWQKFASLRLLYTYQMAYPGKKLLFMGGEIGQWDEWDCHKELQWHLLEYPLHLGLQNLVKKMNHFYHDHPSLWSLDFDWRGYEWIDFSDALRCVIAYLRKGAAETLAIIHNFTPEVHEKYWISLKGCKEVKEVFNSDREEFGGSNVLNDFIQIENHDGFFIKLSPLATMILRITC